MELLPFSHRSISEIGHLAFQFIPKVFDWVEVRTLCRLIKFFHIDLNKPFLYGPPPMEALLC
jgi:hypothetical protein